MSFARYCLPLVIAVALAVPMSSCRKRGVRTEQAANLPPIQVTEFDVDVRQADCAHGVIEASKGLKAAIETEFEKHGFRVGPGGMTARGSATIAKCKGAGGMATVSFFVFSPEGTQLARASKRYKINGKNEKSGADSAGKAATQLVTIVQKSKALRRYAANAHPTKDTAVAANDSPPETKEQPVTEERKVDVQPDGRTVDVQPEADKKIDPEDEANPVVAGRPLSTEWIVAVMDVKDLNAGDKERAIDEDVIRNLGSQLRIYIAQRGAKTVDRSTQEAAVKDQVQEMKNESYKSCYDDSCQVELGKALAASHLLRSQITRFGTRCVLNAELFDLAKEVTIAASSSRGDCEPEGFLRMSEEVANTINAQ